MSETVERKEPTYDAFYDKFRAVTTKQSSTMHPDGFTPELADNQKEWTIRLDNVRQKIEVLKSKKLIDTEPEKSLKSVMLMSSVYNDFCKGNAQLLLPIFIAALEKNIVIDYVLESGPNTQLKWDIPEPDPFAPVPSSPTKKSNSSTNSNNNNNAPRRQQKKPIMKLDYTTSDSSSDSHSSEDSSSSSEKAPKKKKNKRKQRREKDAPQGSPHSAHTIPLHFDPSVKVLKLTKFLPNYNPDSKKSAAITTTSDLIAALLNMGISRVDRALLPDFLQYVLLITAMAKTYSLASILSFDAAFRNWREQYQLSWLSKNLTIEAQCLAPRNNNSFRPSSSKSFKKKNYCYQFNQGNPCAKTPCPLSKCSP